MKGNRYIISSGPPRPSSLQKEDLFAAKGQTAGNQRQTQKLGSEWKEKGSRERGQRYPWRKAGAEAKARLSGEGGDSCETT